MMQKSFEEELNKKASDFSLTPREGLWEEIQVHLVPEKRKRRAVWIWLPATLLAIGGALAYFNGTEPAGIAKNSIQEKAIISSSTQSSNQSASGEVVVSKDIALTGKISKDHFDNSGKKNSFTPKEVVPLAANNNNEVDPLKKEMFPNIMAKELLEQLFIQMEMDSVTNIAPETKPDDTAKKNVTIVPDKGARAPRPDRIYIGCMLTALGSGSTLSMGEQSNPSSNVNGNPQLDYQNRKETDIRIPGFGVGINGGYIRGRHHIYTGLSYQVMGYQMLVKNVVREVPAPPGSATSTNFVKQIAPDTFTSANNSGEGAYFTNRFHYLSFPVGYTFNIIDQSKFSMGLTGNFSYNLLLSSNVLLYDEQSNYYMKQENIRQSGLLKSNFMLALGCDLSYSLNSKLALTLRPQYGFSLNPVEKTAINTRLNYFGIGLGARWFLK